MAKPTVAGAGSNGVRDNPKVTSKFDRMHGHSRTPGHVSGIGGTTHPGAGGSNSREEPKLRHVRHEPSASHVHEHGKVHSYEPGHPAIGGLHHGARAKHPTHDSKQHAYEQEYELHGRGPMDEK